MYQTWESIITTKFHLGKLSKKGWYTLKCPVCNDTKVRAGFKLDHGSWVYNCFRGRCHHRAMWGKSTDDLELTRKAISKLFRAVGIKDDDWTHLLYQARPDAAIDVPSTPEAIELIDPPEVTLPTGAKPLIDADFNDVRFQWGLEWLMDRKVVTESDTSALARVYMTIAPPKKGELDFRNRVIFPFYYQNKLVFFQGAWVNKNFKTKIKYLSTDQTERGNIFYNMDELNRNTDDPIFIVEGLLDAWWFRNSVSVLSNILTDQQIERLNRSPRRKIVIPDFDKAGKELVNDAVDNGWEVSFPRWGSQKDVDEAVRKYGKIIVLKEIMENIVKDPDVIKNNVGIFCNK